MLPVQACMLGTPHTCLVPTVQARFLSRTWQASPSPRPRQRSASRAHRSKAPKQIITPRPPKKGGRRIDRRTVPGHSPPPPPPVLSLLCTVDTVQDVYHRDRVPTNVSVLKLENADFVATITPQCISFFLVRLDYDQLLAYFSAPHPAAHAV